MTAKLPEMGELTLMGAQVLDLVSTCITLGHTNPAHTLDYMHGLNYFHVEAVHDLVAWVSGRESLNAKERGERLAAYVAESGWQKRHADRKLEVLGLDDVIYRATQITRRAS